MISTTGWWLRQPSEKYESVSWDDEISNNMGVSINGGTPIAGWFIMENPTKMDDDWGYP